MNSPLVAMNMQSHVPLNQNHDLPNLTHANLILCTIYTNMHFLSKHTHTHNDSLSVTESSALYDLFYCSSCAGEHHCDSIEKVEMSSLLGKMHNVSSSSTESLREGRERGRELKLLFSFF